MEKTLQDICRDAKEDQHLTTQDLADLTDLSSSTISNYFSASSKDPSLYKMGIICAALGVSIDEYFGIVKRPTHGGAAGRGTQSNGRCRCKA